MSIYILGINSAYHDSAACIIKDGKVIVAVEEERFNRIKHCKKAKVDNPDELPVNAINYCLKKARIKLRDINHIGFSFNPKKRLKNIEVDKYFVEGDWGSKGGEHIFYKHITNIPEKLRELAGQGILNKFHWIDHHLCHAASTFFVSPYKKAAILSIDGIGEFTTTLLGYGNENRIEVIEEMKYPNSLGFLWEKISKFVGFTEYDASKVMSLSAYGNWRKYYPKFQELVKIKSNGRFEVNNNILQFRANNFKAIEDFFGVGKIDNPKDIAKEHKDIVAGLQKIKEEVILSLIKYLSEKTNSENICMAGGVALNCITNSKILMSKYFKNIYIEPAANDAGTALGAAYYVWNNILNRKRNFVLRQPFLGSSYTDSGIKEIIEKNKLRYDKIKNIERITAKLLSKGNIIGWFQGRMEWGPRALGNRSLLADPRNVKIKDKLNKRIKHRETFRPFAPSILEEDASKWFEIPNKCKTISSEFMLFAFDTKKDKQKLIPAVIHIDGTSRIQIVTKRLNPKFYRLILEFQKITGVPMILNTSFNENEPIVCNPQDAINTFKRTKMDYLVIEDYLIKRK